MIEGTLLAEPAMLDLLRVTATASAVSRVFDRAITGSGVSLSQALALAAIDASPQPLLLNGLAARLVQEAQSVTSLVDRLESGGLAQRVHDLRDRRAIRVELTDAGRRKLDEVGPGLREAAAAVVSSLDAEHLRALREALPALYEACRAHPGVRLPEFPTVDSHSPATR